MTRLNMKPSEMAKTIHEAIIASLEQIADYAAIAAVPDALNAIAAAANNATQALLGFEADNDPLQAIIEAFPKLKCAEVEMHDRPLGKVTVHLKLHGGNSLECVAVAGTADPYAMGDVASVERDGNWIRVWR